MKVINSVFSTMWYRSQPAAYNSFRAFIMGTKNQPMFPNGVIYEGVSTEPQVYRGESGANDSIIPTLDNLLEIYDLLPSNPLTAILTEFRTYRPLNHTEWLSYVYETAKKNHVRDFALQDPLSTLYYME